ncbi:hypothetical protein FNV43_RR02125 [Rhamnella rubrinervis]|uniref:F-box domain-containing protein n=1 Tax=Rhamnella rubrinervis TaxID=2594499 RepID=A0A8K0HR38_9ROSA|nr:hypothetical protein FNV43_RR02125 [Rhamnella rubrinervis]
MAENLGLQKKKRVATMAESFGLHKKRRVAKPQSCVRQSNRPDRQADVLELIVKRLAAESFGFQKKKRVATMAPESSFGLQKKRCVAKPQSSVQQSNWSDLHADVLELILKRLAVVDTIRFKAVCSCWNIAASSYVCSPLYEPMLQAPWIMFHYNYKASLNFFSLTENRPYKIKRDDKEDLVLGASHGWLLNFNIESKTPYLLNPFSSSQGGKIQLPWMDCSFSYWMVFNSVVLSSDPSRSKNFTVATLNGFYPQRLSFWDHGDTKWRSINMTWWNVYEYMICHKGEIYAFSRIAWTVDVWDFHGVSPKQTFYIESVPLTLHEQWKVPKEIEYSVERRIFMVESSLLGDILIVERDFLLEPIFFIIGFKVYKLNLSEGRWMPLQGLSDEAILVGHANAVLISTRDFPEFEENSIYYGGEGCDLRVYNLKENKVIKSYPNCRCDADSTCWMVPTFSP